ncbi:MAG: ATP-binding cassette domain-containing protein, partial [Microthrixaceae bacterium]
MTDALLTADEVVAGYLPEVNILNGCSVVLNDAELVGIIGPNGAGKSTMLKAVFGLIPVRSGSVRLRRDTDDGSEIVEISTLKAHQLVKLGVGFVPQTENVFSTLSVKENMEMGAFLEP